MNDIKSSHFIAFVHVPKCGGTTVDRAIGAHLGGRPRHWRLDPRRPLAEMSEEKRCEIRFISGHMAYDDSSLKLLPGRPIRVSLLRDPVARFVSLFNYEQQKAAAAPDNLRNRRILQINLETFADLHLNHLATAGSMCAGFAPSGLSMDAIGVLLNKFALVATLTAIDPFMQVLLQYLAGSPDPSAIGRQRSSGSERVEVTPELRSRLENALIEDRRLVDWVACEQASWFARGRHALPLPRIRVAQKSNKRSVSKSAPTTLRLPP